MKIRRCGAHGDDKGAHGGLRAGRGENNVKIERHTDDSSDPLDREHRLPHREANHIEECFCLFSA